MDGSHMNSYILSKDQANYLNEKKAKNLLFFAITMDKSL